VPDLTAHSWLAKFSPSDWLTAIVVILTAILVVMTYTLLLLSSRPHIVIRLLSKQGFFVDEEATVRLTLYNRKAWYGKSPATHVTAYVNFHQAIEPLKVYYGTNLEKIDTEYRRGKEKSKYFTVKDIALSPDERDAEGHLLGEDVDIKIRLPSQAGEYWMRVVVFTDQNSSRSVRFPLRVTINWIKLGMGGSDY